MRLKCTSMLKGLNWAKHCAAAVFTKPDFSFWMTFVSDNFSLESSFLKTGVKEEKKKGGKEMREIESFFDFLGFRLGIGAILY